MTSVFLDGDPAKSLWKHIESGVAEKVLNELNGGLQTYFGVVPNAFLVDEQNATITW